MSDSRSHEEIRDDLAAYALGALPAHDAENLERHLGHCESCRERLRWLAPAVDLLPASVDQRQAPESLRERLMETVRAEAGVDSAGRGSEPETRTFGLRLRELRPALAIVAATLLAIGVAVGYGVAEGLLTDSAEISGEPTLSEVEPLGAAGIEGTLEREGDLATLRLEQLPRLRPNQVYEAWIDRDGVLKPSTLFVADSARRAVAAITGPLAGADRILVTAEPRGGSRQPTGAPLLEARL